MTLAGAPMTDASAKAQPGDYRLRIPPPAPAEPLPEAIPLTVLFEDQYLIVVDKPPGMAAHPAPGSETGTLVNALLAHCGASLSGVGGVARPGIVHRLDKDTSGVMVAAKTDAAHAGLSALFAAHDIDRLYVALTRGAPEPMRGTITTRLGRSPHDRKKMAVLKAGGREAVTHYAVETAFGPLTKPLAARVACTLETGRTHQIRVHLASLGTPIIGDFKYGGTESRGRGAIVDKLHLHARSIDIARPDGGRLQVTAPLSPHMVKSWAMLGFDPDDRRDPFPKTRGKTAARAPAREEKPARARKVKSVKGPKKKSVGREIPRKKR